MAFPRSICTCHAVREPCTTAAAPRVATPGARTTTLREQPLHEGAMYFRSDDVRRRHPGCDRRHDEARPPVDIGDKRWVSAREIFGPQPSDRSNCAEPDTRVVPETKLN